MHEEDFGQGDKLPHCWRVLDSDRKLICFHLQEWKKCWRKWEWTFTRIASVMALEFWFHLLISSPPLHYVSSFRIVIPFNSGCKNPVSSNCCGLKTLWKLLMCVTCVPEECLMLMSAMELIAGPAWCLGRRTPCQECCASVFKESLSSLKFFSLGIFSNVFIYKCTSSQDEFVPLL